MEPYIGQIMLVAGSYAPKGWAQCDGQLLSMAQNQALFSLLGTRYGGDGITTFRLPDLRGRVVTHPGKGNNLTDVALGQSYGEAANKLAANHIPGHNHTASGTVSIEVSASDDEDTDNPVGGYLRKQNANTYSATPTAKMGPLPVAITVANAGSGEPVPNIQPTLTMIYCIALYGTYPSKS